MKETKVLIASLFLLCPYFIFGQIGVSTYNPSASAVIDLSSTSKGLLIPRLTLTSNGSNPSPVTSPVEGLLVYNNGANRQTGFYFWTGTLWSLLRSNNGNEVAGPSSSTDNAAVRFDGTTGKVIQNSGVLISDNDEITGVNSITTSGFMLTPNPANGRILLSDALGNASWESAPPIDVEQNNILVTSNANTLNFEGGSNVIDNGNYKATVRFYRNNVTKDVIQLSSSDSSDLNVMGTTYAIPWDSEEFKDNSSFTHSNTTNPSRITVKVNGIFEVNFMFSLVNKTIMRKTIRAQFKKNGTTIIPYASSYSFSYNMEDDRVSHVSSSFLIELNANDYIELVTNGQTNTGPATLIPNENVLFMRLLREY